MTDNKTNSGYRNSGDYNSGDYNSGDYNSGDYNSGDYNSGDYNSGYGNSGYRNSGYRNSGDCNSGNRNSGDYNSGDYNSGDCNSGDCNSGDCNSGDYNSGDCNSGDRNSGMFNTNEPKLRVFNKDCDYTRTEYAQKFGWTTVYPLLTEWVGQSGMTAEEKKAHPEFGNTGGYLKTIPYKEAWAKAWGSASQKDKDWFLNLPNFDANIFFEITGIDVRKPEMDLSGSVVEVVVNGKSYKAVIQ